MTIQGCVPLQLPVGASASCLHEVSTLCLCNERKKEAVALMLERIMKYPHHAPPTQVAARQLRQGLPVKAAQLQHSGRVEGKWPVSHCAAGDCGPPGVQRKRVSCSQPICAPMKRLPKNPQHYARPDPMLPRPCGRIELHLWNLAPPVELTPPSSDAVTPLRQSSRACARTLAPMRA